MIGWDFMIATVVALLTGITASMGLGGGFILVIYLTVFAKIPQLEAQGMNLLFFLPIAAFSLFFHVRHRLVEKKVLLPCILPELACVFLGVWLSRCFGSEILRKLFSGFVAAVGVREAVGAFRKPKKEAGNSLPAKKTDNNL